MSWIICSECSQSFLVILYFGNFPHTKCHIPYLCLTTILFFGINSLFFFSYLLYSFSETMIWDNFIIIIWVVEGSVYKIGYLCWDGKMVALKYLFTETVAHQAHATDYDLSFGGAIVGISIPLPTKQKISTLNSSIKIQN